MSEMSRITPAQEAVLNTYRCERLTADPLNRRRSRQFYSRKGRSLVYKLQEDAWYEDRDGVPAAYYVVRNAAGEIAMFFSLKCGTLCDPDYVAKVFEKYDRSRDLMDALHNKEGKEWAYDYLEQMRTSSGTIPFVKKMNIVHDYLDASEERQDIKREKKTEPSSKILRVDEAFPAIELVHFCVNDNARDSWDRKLMGRPLGEVMFWRFVVPKMLEINRLISCEYAYLFAADGSVDGSLINYYENALHFERPVNVGGIKPRYDFLCTFMCKRLYRLSEFRKSCLDPSLYDDEDPLGLEDYYNDFFENYNEVPSMN